MMHCKNNFIQIDANRQFDIIICHYLFVKRNTSSKQFSIFPNHKDILRKSRSYTWTVYDHLPKRGCFSSPQHSWSTIEYSTGIHGNKGEYAGKAEPKNLVSPSMKCLLVDVRAIPPLTEALRSQTLAMHSSVSRIFFLCLYWDCIGSHRVGSNLYIWEIESGKSKITKCEIAILYLNNYNTKLDRWE